jgi:hypothetical protein
MSAPREGALHRGAAANILLDGPAGAGAGRKEGT